MARRLSLAALAAVLLAAPSAPAVADHRGHCAFTPSEIVAAVQAVGHRVHTGHWDATATTRALQAAAPATGLNDNPAFTGFHPGPLVSHRTPPSRTGPTRPEGR